MTEPFQYDVFLSHNQADKPRVRRLAERLRAAGLRVWFDEWTIKHGDIISLKVDEGLEQSRVLLLCISPNALASGWVALEQSTAIHRDPANAGRRFIPLLLADCKLPDSLRRYKYVDYRKENNASFKAVLTACRGNTETEAPSRASFRRANIPGGRSSTIVVIDDEKLSMVCYVKALEHMGFGVQQISTVDEALKHIQETNDPADLYVIDMMMPYGSLDPQSVGYGMSSGIEVRRRLRLKFQNVPVILLSNVRSRKILEQFPSDGRTECYSKSELPPFELASTIQQMLDRAD